MLIFIPQSNLHTMAISWEFLYPDPFQSLSSLLPSEMEVEYSHEVTRLADIIYDAWVLRVCYLCHEFSALMS